MTHQGAGLMQGNGPVDAQGVCAGVGQRRQPDTAPFCKDNHGNFTAPAQAGDDARHGIAGKAQEIPCRQHPAPGVEDHQRLSTRFHLRIEIIRHRLRQRPKQRIQQFGVVEQQALDMAEIVPALPLDHVGGKGPGGPREPDQRTQAVQFPPHFPYCIDDITQRNEGIWHRQLTDGVPVADGVRETRTLPVDEIEAKPHRIGHSEDVGKQDGRIKRIAAHRLHRDLAGPFRILTQIHERSGARPHGTIFGQVAASLPHEPDGRLIDGLAPQGAEKTVAAIRDVAAHSSR